MREVDGDRRAYALEVYASRLDRASALAVRDAADALRQNGTDVRFLRSISMPQDEICFLVLESPSPEAVLEVARCAGLAFERLVEVELAGPLSHDEECPDERRAS